MGVKGDFYIEDEGQWKWIGSVSENGEPWHMPIVLLAQVNPIMFEEKLDEYFKTLRKHYEHVWPWDWDDSQLTDY